MVARPLFAVCLSLISRGQVFGLKTLCQVCQGRVWPEPWTRYL